MLVGRGRARLWVLLAPVALVAAVLTPAAASAAAAPSLTIVTPTQGTSVSGLTSVTVQATTDAGGADISGSSVLYVDGKAGGGANGCFPASHDCTFHFLFDWSGYTGNHTMQVKGATADGVPVSSNAVTVAAVSPPPHAGITSPSEGETVSGEVAVRTVGIIDPSQDADHGNSMQLFVDGSPAGFSYCFLRPLCDISVGWDASTAAPGRHTLLVEFTTSLGKTALSPAVHVVVAAPPVLAAPTVQLDSPADGATVTGLGSAHLTATTDPQGGDAPATTRLYLDGALASSASCATSASTCSVDHLYDVSGLVGSHTLQAQLTTRGGVTVSSQTVTITVVSPLPTVVVTGPLAGATVTGSHVPVTAQGTIDPHQTFDFPLTIALAVDGTTVDSEACGTASATTCATGLDWSTAGAALGAHSLVVTLTTTHGRVGSSLPVVVTLALPQQQPVPTALSLALPGTYHRGAVGAARGSLTQVSGGVPIVGAAVAVTFTGPGGTPVTTSAVTDGQGRFVAVDPVRLAGSTAVLATVGADLGSASATQRLPVALQIVCSVPARAAHGTAVKVTCAVPGLTHGGVVALHDAGPRSRGLLHGRAAGGFVTFVLDAPAAQRLSIWATTDTTRSFVASSSVRYGLRVR